MRNFEEKEEVKVVHKTSEVQTKEFEKAAKRLANANLVIVFTLTGSQSSTFLLCEIHLFWSTGTEEVNWQGKVQKPFLKGG